MMSGVVGEDEKPTILIVEDDQIISRIVEIKLMESGYAVFPVVISGEGAIRSAIEDRPGVILMDITLQGRVDGIEASRIIDTLFRIPTIFVTSHEDENTVRKITTTSAATFLKKPFRLTDLLTNLEIIARNARHMRKTLGIIPEEYDQFARLLNQKGIWCYITREDGSILYVNDDYLDKIGKEAEDVILTPISDLISLNTGGDAAPVPSDYDISSVIRFLGNPLITMGEEKCSGASILVNTWKMLDPDEQIVGNLVICFSI